MLLMKKACPGRTGLLVSPDKDGLLSAQPVYNKKKRMK